MVDVRCNFKNKYVDTLCPLCKSDQDTQEHLMVCTVLRDTEIVEEIPLYEYLWQKDINKLSQTASILKKQFEKRQEMIKLNTTNVAHVNQ